MLHLKKEKGYCNVKFFSRIISLAQKEVSIPEVCT